jgi:hypothetical protein
MGGHMDKSTDRLRSLKSESNVEAYCFYCPGCKGFHTIYVNGGTYTWGWNGSKEKPTFTPSILIRTGCHAPQFNSNQHCWCTYELRIGKKSPFKCGTCHSFVTDGKIQFLSDCSHELAGQTVDLPTLEEVDRLMENKNA